MFRLLLIEDSYDLREEVKEYFSLKGNGIIELDMACDGSDGLEKIRSREYGLVMADIRQRGDLTVDLCRRIRDNCKCPIVYISDLNMFEETDLGYAIGADDLILKPFVPMDLFYVALEYASGKKSAIKMLECGGIRMHPITGLVTVDGKVVDLPDRLMMILKVLLENKPDIVNRDTILKEVWGSGYSGSDRVVDTQIKYLRKYLGKKGDLIQTVKGSGYRMKGI
ncbi:MAG: response regulator transcription factor [Clostridiales bacterium]|nr:response regulator transcription factor [Clostridiales bacterium]